jgi:hypothetical protein
MKANEMGRKFRTRGRDKNVYEMLIVEPEGKDGFRGADSKTKCSSKK